uniref:Phosphatidylethanolamine N-methyltransferase n=1 Tax=Sinocyclocheilus anshuiensis TaxID=1608454 RepID=A0A671PVT2_9TELE
IAYTLLLCFVVSFCPQMDMSVLAELWRLIDLSEPRFCVAVIAIIFNPFFWNVVARWEHRTRGLTRLFGGPYVACYALAGLILLLNVYRSHSITVAMKAHPRWEPLDNAHVYYAGAALMALGSVFVISSFMALGVTGTFLEQQFYNVINVFTVSFDQFDVFLLNKSINFFPKQKSYHPKFNVLCLSLRNASPVGVILTAVVGLSYKVAIAYEGPHLNDQEPCKNYIS